MRRFGGALPRPASGGGGASAAACLAVAALTVLAACAEARAQAAQEVPVQRDLRRMERIERRLDRNRPPRIDPNVTPDNPDGVVGFDGPPGAYGDSVLDDGPLPPGSPADADDD